MSASASTASSPTQPPPDKPPSTARGVVWAGLSQAGRVGVQLLALAVLSRLLPPGDFGLLAMATVVTAFVALMRDMGTAAAVIQRADLPPAMLDTVFWFNLSLGLSLSVAVFLLAGPAAVLFKEPRLADVLRVLSISFPIASAGAVHQALLERRVAFRALARIELSSAVLGLLVAVVCAWRGLGVYSLVLNQIVVSAASTLQLWLATRWRPAWQWQRAMFSSLVGFSGNLFGSQLLNYFARNADSMLIGRYLGAADLGWYGMAYKIMLFPIQNLSQVVARATFPVLSQRQADPQEIGRLYLRSISAIALVTSPLMVGLWVLREPFIVFMLGARWAPVAEVLMWLAPVGLVQSIMTTTGVLYMSTGRTDMMLRWGILSVVVTLGAMAIGLQWGYIGVAACYAAANVLLMGPSLHLALRQIQLGVLAVVPALGWQWVAAACMGAVVYLAKDGLARAGLLPGAAVQLLVLVPLGAVTYSLLCWLLLRPTLQALGNSLRTKRQSR